MYRALLVDFYGTLVAEDDALIARIADGIARASQSSASPSDVRAHWNRHFRRLCTESFGDRFAKQREIELESLRGAARDCGAKVDVEALSAELFAYWAAPAPLAGAAEFLRDCPLPLCIVSNIDDAELAAAICGLGWDLPRVVTSEGCRAYKPRGEMFRTALELLGCEPSEVLHVGDSLGSDVGGALAAGIDVAWLNPTGRAPGEHQPRYVINSVRDVPPLLTSPRSTPR